MTTRRDFVPGAAAVVVGAALPLTARAAETASRAIYEAVLETVAAGTRTPDLGGHANTTEFADAVIASVQRKLDVWASLGTRS